MNSHLVLQITDPNFFLNYPYYFIKKYIVLYPKRHKEKDIGVDIGSRVAAKAKSLKVALNEKLNFETRRKTTQFIENNNATEQNNQTQ